MAFASRSRATLTPTRIAFTPHSYDTLHLLYMRSMLAMVEHEPAHVMRIH